MIKQTTILFLLLVFATQALQAQVNTNADPAVSTKVDLDKHLGVWYEIARRKDFFWEKNMVGIKLDYTRRKGNKLKETYEGKRRTLSGKTVRVKTHIKFYKPGKFKDPFGLKHGVLYLDENYQYIMYGTLNRKYVWILSRKPTMDDATYKMLIDKARTMGYIVDDVRKTPQEK